MNSYLQYRQEAEKIAKAGGIPIELLPGERIIDDRYFIRIDSNRIEYVYTERGHETVEPACSLDELLFFVFRDITRDMASHYEGTHRIRGEDSRRQFFRKHIEFLGALNKEWGQLLDADYQERLRVNPFDDILAKRADHWGELMAQGISREEAVKRAEELFPYPVDEG